MPPTRSDLHTLLAAIDTLLELTELIIDGQAGRSLRQPSVN